MRRKRNRLYFDRGEEEKFLRAIRLFGRVRKFEGDMIERSVEHEKAHINKMKELGCDTEEKLRGYWIKGDRFGKGFMACIDLRFRNLSKKEIAEIALAPEYPSVGDIGRLLGNIKYASTKFKAVFMDHSDFPNYHDLRKQYLR
jgi:hypothetical protein